MARLTGASAAAATGPDAAVCTALAALLPHAAPASIETLAARAAVRAYARHDRLLSQDDPARLVLVLDGHLAAWRSDAAGRQQIVALSGPREFASLLAVSEHGPPFDLVALSAGRTATWDGALVLALAAADAGLATDLFEHAIHAANRLLTRLEHLSFDSVSRRLARLFWQRRDLLFDRRRPLLSRPELADLAGATREMVDRVIREFEHDGIVRRVGATGLELVDPATLRALADPDADERECT